MVNRLVTQGSTGTHSIQRVMGDVLHKPAGWNHHQRKPDFPKEDKVVYLFCNPFDFILSLWRIEERTGSWIRDHIKNTQGDYRWFETYQGISLIDFLESDYDPIRYQEHAENYRQADCDVLFCRYESLEAYGLRAMCAFWGVDVPQWEYRQRISNWETEHEEIQTRLWNKYGDVMLWYRSLPFTQELKHEKANV